MCRLLHWGFSMPVTQSTHFSKSCFKCGAEKPLDDFYKHPKMPDGHVNKCKECNKKDVRENRNDKVEYYREYDKERGNRQDYSYIKGYREKFPKKYKAHTLVNNSIRAGILKPSCCEVCGILNTVAHHDDYDKPLEVRWLCQAHHVQWHKVNGPGLNGD